MAISLVSGNLNSIGNTGQFETDRSTWGLPPSGYEFNNSYVAITRSISQQTAGLYSLRAETIDDYAGEPYYINYAKFNSVAGKKYVLRANLYTPDLASSAIGVYFENQSGLTEISRINGTLPSPNAWQQIELKVTATTTGDKVIPIRSAAFLSTGAIFYFDQVEVYEYIDVVVSCTLAINAGGTTVTNETAPGANNGTITVATSGGSGTLEYSKDNGTTWQSSNLFTGLAPAVYQVKVRETANLSCVASQSFAVNAAAASFSFTTVATDETILGASDGTINVTVTGTVAPFTFSKDGGTTYQSSNVFTGLAPGTYTIVVKDAGALTRAANVTIGIGFGTFEKVWFSQNPVLFQKAAASGWGSLTNVRLFDDVRVDDEYNGVFVSKLKLALPPETNGNVVFQVRQAFRNVLKAIPPTLNSNQFVQLKDRIKYFKHYTGQMSGLEYEPASLTSSLPHLVLMGGLSKYAYASINFFGSYLTSNKKFLTWAPVVKQVDRNQEDYLNYFVFDATTTSLKLSVKAYYDDGTNQTSNTLTKTGVSYGQLYQLPSGPVNSGALAINAAKNLLQYEVSLLDQADSLVSEVRTYVIDAVTHPRKRLFLFLNSLGSYEVLRFTGVAEASASITKNEIVKFLPVSYAATDGEFEVNNSFLREQKSLGTGYGLTAEWLDYMKDFLMSKRVYDVTDGKRIPISIEGGDFEMNADQTYERFVRFAAKNVYEDENYTPYNL